MTDIARERCLTWILIVVAFTMAVLGLVETIRSEPTNPPIEFIRGDTTNDGRVMLSDGILILWQLYTPEVQLIGCLDSADVDDDGNIDLGDIIYMLRFIFARESPPPSPFPALGIDPTPDNIEC